MARILTNPISPAVARLSPEKTFGRYEVRDVCYHYGKQQSRNLMAYLRNVATVEHHEYLNNALEYTQKLVQIGLMDTAKGTTTLVARCKLGSFTVLGMVPGDVMLEQEADDAMGDADANDARTPWIVPTKCNTPRIVLNAMPLAVASAAGSANLLDGLYMGCDPPPPSTRKPVMVRGIFCWWQGAPRFIYMTGLTEAEPGSFLVADPTIQEKPRPPRIVTATVVAPPAIYTDLEEFEQVLRETDLPEEEIQAILEDKIQTRVMEAGESAASAALAMTAMARTAPATPATSPDYDLPVAVKTKRSRPDYMTTPDPDATKRMRFAGGPRVKILDLARCIHADPSSEKIALQAFNALLAKVAPETPNFFTLPEQERNVFIDMIHA